MDGIIIRNMREADIDYFADAFAKLGWGDKRRVLAGYFEEQEAAKRTVLVAECENTPAGYVTLVLSAVQGPFAGMNIPEIIDFNVLPPYRRKGIGSRLMNEVEAVAKTLCRQVSLAVGLHSGYGAAQRMYVRRGYLPDGSGAWYKGKPLAPYANCVNDDELVLFFVKELE